MQVRDFLGEGGVLRIAFTQALGMGGVEAVSAAAPLLGEYKVRCLAMCGVCAGRRRDTELGDVIIADRMWTYDTGKIKVEIDDQKQRVEHEKGDMEIPASRASTTTPTPLDAQPDPEAWASLRKRVFLAGCAGLLVWRPAHNRPTCAVGR